MAKIAVVEDNDAMREQLCGFIAQYARESGRQLDVTAFADGAEIVDPYRPGFDIIFLDIEMPTLGGMPTAERIRQVRFLCFGNGAGRNREKNRIRTVEER